MKDFIFTLLAWLLTLPFIIAAVAFAIYNGDIIPVTLNPFQNPIPMPVYVPVLGGIAFGFIFGSLMTWAGMGRLRKERREQKKRIKTLEKQLEVANTNHVAAHNYAQTPPALLEKF